MSDDEKSRLYKQIVRQTPEFVLLERMRVHGFWPAGHGLPPDPPGEQAERGRIEAELETLRQASAAVRDPEKALRAERERRWKESRERRAAAKARRVEQARQRRAEWEALRSAQLVHAGAGVSGALDHKTSDSARLAERGLPVLHTAVDLACFLELPISKLRWLTYHRRGATLVHYRRFEIAKKTGGVRCISAPKPALAAAQAKLLRGILTRLVPEPHAHGFVLGRSILSNATPHVGCQVVLNLDLKEFFPSITFRRVRGLFTAVGYSGQVATALALLCTEPPRVPAQVGGKRYWVALGQRVLPQGACTSPAITNALCRRLDRRLHGLALRHGFTYTRYADDLSFSGDRPETAGRLLRSVRAILAEEGFREHPRKTRVMRRSRRQEVTGVTVNSRPTVSRGQVRELRAILHNAARYGLDSQNREGRRDFAAVLRGRVEFVSMVDPVQGRKLRAALELALSAEPPPYSAALARAIGAAREAGALLRAELHRGAGQAPEPELDERVEGLLRARLLAGSSWGFQGRLTDEARADETSPRWIVDPNDGAVWHRRGRRGAAVSIGAVHRGVPVLGVVYAFAWPDDLGDLFAWAEGCGPMLRNGRPVKPKRSEPDPTGAIVLVPAEAELQPESAPRRFIVSPAASHRLALVAAGDAAGSVIEEGAEAWRLAAGEALLRAVGRTLSEAVVEAAGQEHDAEVRAASAEEQPRSDSPIVARFSISGRVADAGRLARAQGCLLGQLAGDSLGGLVEFRSAQTIRQAHPQGVRELIDGGQWRNLAGQPTDDSELALMLARTLVRERRYDPRAALDAYVHWYRSGPFDVGGTIGAALGAAAWAPEPEHAMEAALARASRISQANGSLMRISPIGIFAAGRPALAADWARLDSGLTHPHPVCRDACAVFSAAISEAIAEGGGPEACYEAALEEARRSAAEPVRKALQDARSTRPADYQTKMGWVLIGLQNAFYQLLHAPSAEEGIVVTVLEGGDTDTNAAIAGALLGAVHGREAIPRRWRLALQACRPLPGSGTAHPRPAEFWPSDVLELAEQLLASGPGDPRSQASGAGGMDSDL
jgi:ADP-ribosylglycohydrolase/fructose-1,6-bisphosphatase/inositol monophosphatase family enzyme/retron-type reverse transcriptase